MSSIFCFTYEKDFNKNDINVRMHIDIDKIIAMSLIDVHGDNISFELNIVCQLRDAPIKIYGHSHKYVNDHDTMKFVNVKTNFIESYELLFESWTKHKGE